MSLTEIMVRTPPHMTLTSLVLNLKERRRLLSIFTFLFFSVSLVLRFDFLELFTFLFPDKNYSSMITVHFQEINPTLHVGPLLQLLYVSTLPYTSSLTPSLTYSMPEYEVKRTNRVSEKKVNA